MSRNRTNKKNNKTPESPEFNNLVRYAHDGNEFHFLWAARRCLRLLLPQDDLIKISIEGSDGRAGRISVGTGEEVIDVAEYFGDENNYSQVSYIQLKHSTRRKDRPWTASEMEKTIRGFAKKYDNSKSSNRLEKSINFRFVTNRPVSPRFKADVKAIRAGKKPYYQKDLKKKLESSTCLKGNALASFLKLLFFDDCQDDYWEQRNILSQRTGNYLVGGDDASLRLVELVRRKALSEGSRNPDIDKIDVLRTLGITEEDLFPSRCMIEKLDKEPIPFPKEEEIIQEIIKANSPIVIHADAGIGKTVFATRIQDGLPNGSECILYDCFGNGLYRNLSTSRHRHEDALVQIANELAGKGLCYPLIPYSGANKSSYMRAFVSRINNASTFLKLKQPSALLCIVIDAADNAQMAAEENNEQRSFVQDLIRERIPDNVRLVFLCRTHRKNYLKQPHNTMSLELPSFGYEETKKHLQQRYHLASDHDVGEFHRLSSKNPRVQALALSLNETLDSVLSSFGSSPKRVEDTIRNLLEGAISKMQDEVGNIEATQIEDICKGLAILRPQIPIQILSRVSNVEEGAIRSFVTNLGRPLLNVDNSIRFLDEPVETWFQENHTPEGAEMDKFITRLKPLAEESTYVASILPQIMLTAEKLSELVELALTSEGLPENPVEKHNIELQRLQFALKATLRLNRYLDSAKLALKAGGKTVGKNRQDMILQENADLVARFSQPGRIHEIISQLKFEPSWFGSRYAYEAVLLSNRPELIEDARNRLRTAHKYLTNWNRQPEDEREIETVSNEDVANFTIAEINIHGPEYGVHRLSRWVPKTVSLHVGKIVARYLIEHNRFEDLDKFAYAADANGNLYLVLAIASELQEIQRLPPKNVTRHAFQSIVRSFSSAENNLKADITDICPIVEASLIHKVCTRDDAVVVISHYLPSEFLENISYISPKGWTPTLMSYCLRATLQKRNLDLRELANPKLQEEIDKEEQYNSSSELRRFRETVGALLPWCQLWASTLLGHVKKETLGDKIEQTRKASSAMSNDYHVSSSNIKNEIALLWFQILYRVDATDTVALDAFSDWKNKLSEPLFTPTLISIARLCGRSDATRQIKELALQYSQEVYDIIRGDNIDAGSKSKCFIDSARAIISVSPAKAEWFYNEAIVVANEIGEENIPRWEAILCLAERAPLTDYSSPKIAYHFARCAELTYGYVFRDKHFDWNGTIEALCGLCPSSSLAIISRWQDRGFGWSERILPIAINRLVEDGKLDARDALPLIGFRAQWDYNQMLNNVLSVSRTKDEKETAVKHLYRYMQFEGRGDYTKIKETISEHDLEIEGIDEMNCFDVESEVYSRTNEPRSVPDNNTPDWDAVFCELDLTTDIGVSQAYSKFKKANPPWSHERFFKEIIERVPLGRETNFIKALNKISEFDTMGVQFFLKQVPEKWRKQPHIINELGELYKNACSRFCMHIEKSRYYEDYLGLSLRDASTLTGVSKDDIIDIILNAIGEISDFIGSDRLFSLIGLLADKLTPNEALDALQYGLDFFNDILADKHGDGEWSDNLRPPGDIKESLAGYIWASMASPDTVLRWEGAHVILGIIALERKEVLEHVFEFAEKRTGGPFVDSNLVFYDLHALQWLLIGLARAAIEFPEILVLFKDQIIGWALNDQPHVLIRQFAARASLALINKGVITDEHKSDLENINISNFPHVQSERYHRTDGTEKTNPNEDDYFYFGPDIGPYWYAPLGEVFALSQREIESKALKVIREKFTSQGTGERNKDERNKRNLYNNQYRPFNRNSYPRINDLHFYHSYHAMMIVAGNLLADTPVHSDPKWVEENGFTDWLKGHDLSRTDGRWLWNRRDPSPLKHSKDDFDDVLHATNMLNIWGDWTTGVNTNYEQTIRIRSALVSPDKSSALLTALSKVEWHYYAIPSANSEHENSEHEIDQYGFLLKGWIIDEGGYRGLDRLDRWAGGIDFPPPMPILHIIDKMKIQTDLDYRLWKNQENSTVMESQQWGYFDENEPHEISSQEKGNRLQANKDFLESMLRELNCDLIIDINIGFSNIYQPYGRSVSDDEEKIPPTKSQLYLFKANDQLHKL